MIMKKKEEDLQKKIVQFQVLEATFKTLQDRANLINQNLDELRKTKIAIEDLKKTKPNKALIPLGSGNFVYGTIENNENVIVGIGAGIAIKKKREESIEILDNKTREMENVLDDVTTRAQGILEKIEEIQMELEELQK